MTIQLEEVNPKIQVKEDRLKRYWNRVKQCNKTGPSKIIKENSTHSPVEHAQGKPEIGCQGNKKTILV